MKFSHYLKRVEDSGEFKKFQQEHKKAYLCAGFFVLDFEQGKNMHQIDFLIPKSKKIATFMIDEGIKLNFSPQLKAKMKLEKIEGEVKTDLDALKGIVIDEMHNRTITQEIKKIIAVLQNDNGKKVWKLNCITADMGIIRAHIDDETSSILEMEKASLFDFIKMIPKSNLLDKGKEQPKN
ncbi:hypothetical protein FJZ19_04500 [Candidatus Pacearchaeota archaeon]|nr:hypothetical protein [Candidatus Pacearchaeota archaeon]